MTTNLRNIALAAIVAVASLAPALHAQSDFMHAQVSVPFSFDYGTTHFGRGTYVLSMNGENSLMVRNPLTNQTAIVMARLEESPIEAKTSVVTFRKYGDRWFLEQVDLANSGTSVSVYESKAERQAAHDLASRGEEASQVALALLPERAIGR